MKNTVTVRRVRVLWDMGRGLRWRWAYQADDNPPQATRWLALAWYDPRTQTPYPTSL